MLFISPQKLFIFLRYFNFCTDFLAYVAKRIEKKAKVNLKTYDVIFWKTIIINILPNISRSKDNQAMKFG